jgi:hypothetical protein
MTLLILFFNLLFSGPPPENCVPATINGEQVHANEVLFEMINERTGVYTSFASEYHLGEEPLRWTKKYKGKKPIAVLRDRALTNAIRIKMVQIQMRVRNIQTDIGYVHFEKRYQQFTQDREQSTETNNAIYGPPHLSPSNYYYYIYSNNLIQLREQLAKDGISSDESYEIWLNDLLKRATIKLNKNCINHLNL